MPFDSISCVAYDTASLAAGAGSQGIGQAVLEHSYYDPRAGNCGPRALWITQC